MKIEYLIPEIKVTALKCRRSLCQQSPEGGTRFDGKDLDIETGDDFSDL